MLKGDLLSVKKLNIALDKDFPFQVTDSYGIAADSTILHWHDCFEICYIKQGTGIYLIGGRRYQFSQGDVFIVGNKDVHLAYNESNLIMQVILFEPGLLWNGAGYNFEMEYLTPFWEAGINFDNKIDSTNKYHKIITDILLEIEKESKTEEKGYKLVIKSLILRLSSVLSRCFDFNEDGKIPGKMLNYKRLEPIFEYIDKNFYLNIKLKDLADLVNMSVSNFSLIFKQIKGISPMEYLIRLRIVKATQILLETDEKIVDVAMSCGFSSMSNFIDNFKKYTGKIPRDFRKIRK